MVTGHEMKVYEVSQVGLEIFLLEKLSQPC